MLCQAIQAQKKLMDSLQILFIVAIIENESSYKSDKSNTVQFIGNIWILQDHVELRPYWIRTLPYCNCIGELKITLVWLF